MAQAPVCHIPPESDVPQPTVSSLPAIPPVISGDWQSIMDSIAAMTQAINMLSGRGPSSGPNSAAGSGGKQKVGRFQEVGRTKRKLHVTNPDDDSQFVDVEVVASLTMQDTVTGEQWTWQL